MKFKYIVNLFSKSVLAVTMIIAALSEPVQESVCV
jgi:hypothetical protein